MPECVKMHKFSVSHPNTFKYTQTSSWRVSVYIPNIFQWYSNFPMIKPNTSPQRIGSCQSSSFFGRRSSLGPGCCSVKMKASALSWCQMMPVSSQCYWILLGCELLALVSSRNWQYHDEFSPLWRPTWSCSFRVQIACATARNRHARSER